VSFLWKSIIIKVSWNCHSNGTLWNNADESRWCLNRESFGLPVFYTTQEPHTNNPQIKKTTLQKFVLIAIPLWSNVSSSCLSAGKFKFWSCSWGGKKKKKGCSTLISGHIGNEGELLLPFRRGTSGGGGGGGGGGGLIPTIPQKIFWNPGCITAQNYRKYHISLKKADFLISRHPAVPKLSHNTVLVYIFFPQSCMLKMLNNIICHKEVKSHITPFIFPQSRIKKIYNPANPNIPLF